MSLTKHPSTVIIEGHPTLYSQWEKLPTTISDEQIAIESHVQDNLVECFVISWGQSSLAVIHEDDSISLIEKGDEKAIASSLWWLTADIQTIEWEKLWLHYIDTKTSQALQFTLKGQRVDVLKHFIIKKSHLVQAERNDEQLWIFWLAQWQTELKKIVFANRPLSNLTIRVWSHATYLWKGDNSIAIDIKKIIDSENPFEIQSKRRHDEPLIVEITDNEYKQAWNEKLEYMWYFYIDSENENEVKRFTLQGNEVFVSDINKDVKAAKIRNNNNNEWKIWGGEWKKLDYESNTLSSYKIDDNQVRVSDFIEEYSSRARMYDIQWNDLWFIDTKKPKRVTMNGEFVCVTPYGNWYFYITPKNGECLWLGLIDFNTHEVKNHQWLLITSTNNSDGTFTVKSKSWKDMRLPLVK